MSVAAGATQGRTQNRADGAKAPLPEIPRKKLFTHLNTEHFMFRSLFILLQIMFPRFNWLIDITISPIAVVDKFFLHNKHLVL